MTTRSDRWTRRQFSQAVAATAAVSLLGRQTRAESATVRDVAFVASSAPGADAGRVTVYRVSGSRWTQAGELQAEAPAHLALHPTLPVLYVVHAVTLWQNLPRGAVSAYRVDPSSGALTHMVSQPLSLSATAPRHALVAAGGTALFVSAAGGGLYNALPIAPDGALLPVCAMRKEFGRGEEEHARTASPQHAVLHPDGSILSADPGQGTLSRFRLRRDSIALLQRTAGYGGVSPSQVVLSPCGGYAYAMCGADGSVAVHAVSGLESAHSAHPAADGPGAMAMHPGGRFLLASGERRTVVLRIDAKTGRVAAHSVVDLAGLRSPRFSRDGATLTALHPASGTVLSLPFHASHGTLGRPVATAEVGHATSLLQSA